VITVPKHYNTNRAEFTRKKTKLNNKTNEQAFTIQYSSKAKGLLPGL